MYYKSVHGTAVIFLQNNAGFSKWEPTTERIQEFLAAYNVSGRSLPSPGPPSTSTGDKDSKPVQERLAKTQDDSSPVDKTNPWNIMIKHRQVHRRGRRSQMAVSYTDPVISMDLLRTVLQPSFNEDIRAVFRKYMKFFEKAASNVKENVGVDVQPEQLIRDACRNCLEHVKHDLFLSCLFIYFIFYFLSIFISQRARQPDDTSGQRDSPIPKKRKGRPPGTVVQYDRPASYSTAAKLKISEPIKREGPKWDPSRLTESSTFVLGSRANKALGMGGTRGRIYIKHAELFKYAADAQDKHWLSERQHMRATGGKMAYLLIEEDVLDLARSEDYKDCPDLKLDELKPFLVPIWMVEKMQKAMEAQKSENDLVI
uniref:Deoxynucleotidyltransferase terminal-interacting protein 1 n=1 Tax=Sinocyclocheilus grahami TaxID=75366 RepID=A0A672NDX7_SINGR